MSTYYVSTTGSDSNPGTSASPWRHFSHAASIAQGGDTVLFADGTYDNEGKVAPNYVVTLSNSGTAGNVITFKAQNRGAAILDGGVVAGSGGAYAYINFGNASYVAIDGFVVQNTADEGFHDNDSAHHITVRNCTIRYIANVPAYDSYGRDGIFCGPLSHDFVFDSCIWHDIGRSGSSQLDHGIYVKCPNVTITNCIFYNQTKGWDIQLADGANNILIANNVFASHHPVQSGQIMVWDNHTSVTIRNNIFYNPPNVAITNYTESVNSSFIDHNLITNSAGVYSGSGFTIGANQLNVDPLFTNPGAFDFTLQVGSPAINAGATIAGVGADSLGVARPQGGAYDIGAYEYTGTPTSAPAIASFVANSSTIFAGQSSTLSWSTTGATTVSIDNGIGTVTASSVPVSPTVTTTYTLTATNANGSSTATVTVTLSDKPVIDSFAVTPPAITAGNSATLSFNVAGATSLSIDNGIGTVTGGSIPVSPIATTTYTLTATNASGSSTQTATVTIQDVGIGQTGLTTITESKELEVGYRPLHLVTVTFADATVLRLSSEIGVTYSGNAYQPRLKAQSFQEMSSVSNAGIVQSPAITLQISDADHSIWNTWELGNGKGFKGAEVVVTFLYWDPIGFTFSSDSRVIFRGICNPAQHDAATLMVTATNKLSLAYVMVPRAPVSKHCIWDFPATAAQRQEAADDPYSPFYHCGYSPDATGSNARGNLNGGSPFTSCGKNWGDCIARMGNAALPFSSTTLAQSVQIEEDTSGRHTARFGGLHFQGPLDWRGKAYITGNTTEGANNQNDARFNDYVPQIWGKSRVGPIIMPVLGDPNGTRFEAIIGLGEIGDWSRPLDAIEAVLCNDTLIPHVSQASNQLLAWNWISIGSRDGLCNRSPIYDGKGDPYGSIACIMIGVPVKVAASSSVPNVVVITKGPKVRIWNSATVTDFTTAYSTNPVWNLLDMLLQWNWTADDIDLQSFIDEAAYCDGSITYTDLTGNASATHARFKAGLAIRDRRSASELLTNYLASFRAILRESSITGKLQVMVKKTLALQQPNPIASSNNQTQVAGGYLAYDFTDANIKMQQVGKDEWMPSLRFAQRSYAETPNRISANLQDEEYNYVADSLRMTDPDDTARTGLQIDGSITAEGLLNYDQTQRILQALFAENFNGNPRTPSTQFSRDTGGTIIAEWETTAKAIDLRCGEIVRLQSTIFNFPATLFRVQGINTTADSEVMTITATYHKDAWYSDSFGQLAQSYAGNPPSTSLRGPYGWCPDEVAPTNADALYDPTDLTFSIAHQYVTASDGTTAVALKITGKAPVNQFSDQANTPVARTAAAAGGTMPAATYWVNVCAVDSNGLETALGPITPYVTLDAPGGITISNIAAGAGTAGLKLYAGTSPNHLSLQGSAGAVSSATISAYKVLDQGPPDQMFQKMKITAKKVYWSGVFTAPITAFSSSSITILNAGITTDFAGNVATLVGKGTPTLPLPVGNFAVSSAGGDTISFGANALGHSPDLTALGVKIGDVFTVRAHGRIVTPNQIGDGKFSNGFATEGMPVNIRTVGSTTPRVVTTNTPHMFATGDRVRISDTQAQGSNLNADWFITVVDDFSFSLDASTFTVGNDYLGGGQAKLLTYGMKPNAEIGHIVEIIEGTGKGQTRRITANDATTVTVDTPWDTLPDATSIWIIEDPGFLGQDTSDPIQNSDPAHEATFTLQIPNSPNTAVRVQALTVSGNGQESLEFDSPIRDYYITGPKPLPSNQFYDIIFGLGIGGPAEVGTDVCPPRAIRNPGTLMSVSIIAKFGGPCTVQLYRTPTGGSPVALLANPLSSSGTDLVLTADLTFPGTDPVSGLPLPLELIAGDLITVDCLSSGGAQEVTIDLKVRAGSTS